MFFVSERLGLRWLVRVLALGVPGTVPAQAQTPHYVFAHYMVCFATYGESIQSYQREIKEAQAAGIDGFALNVGAWSGPDAWYYKSRVQAIYNAAEALTNGFKLFLSVEVTNTADILDMVTTYAGRTNSFRYLGNLVVSTYGQNGLDWSNSVLSVLNSRGINVCFVPFFWPEPLSTWPSYSTATNTLSKYGSILDGLFWFTAAGLPAQMAQNNTAYGQACKDFHRLFMAGFSPHYWGMAQPSLGRRYVETQGGEGTTAQWTSILTNQPNWVEICTWNDFNESTYLSPADDPGLYSAGLQAPRRFSHAGYLELSKHFIAWYKSGQEPAVDRDAIFYFYRIHPKAAVASNTNDIPVTWWIGDVEDTIYITAALTAPGVLEISSGTTLTTNSLPAGISHSRAPFAPGPQIITLRRAGEEPLSVQGPDVLSQIQNYDFFPASGFVYRKPPPPANIRVEGP